MKLVDEIIKNIKQPVRAIWSNGVPPDPDIMVIERKELEDVITAKLNPVREALQELLSFDGGPGAVWDAIKYDTAREKALVVLALLSEEKLR